MKFKHSLLGKRARSTALSEHLNGFMGFVMRDGREMTQVRYAVLQHLQRVQHHLSLEVSDEHFDAFSQWATAANALVFFPDSSVRNPRGAVLVDAETGEPEGDAQLPFPSDAIERAERSHLTLTKQKLKLPKLPPVVSEVEVELRSTAETFRRLQAIFLCAVRAEAVRDGADLTVDELAKKLPEGFAALSPNERAFIDDPKPAPQSLTNFGWRYEAAWTLAWALQLVPTLPPAENICDVPLLARTLFKAKASNAQLRSAGEILDALDLHFRLHWVTTEARVRKQPVPAGLEPGVIFERHYALNWLTNFEAAEWDDVQTPT